MYTKIKSQLNGITPTNTKSYNEYLIKYNIRLITDYRNLQK